MEALKIFCSYARADQAFVGQLKTHFTPLLRQYPWTFWSDADISPGSEWEREIQKHLDSAQIILLLISPDFMISEYCFGKEMKRALERHDLGEAQVIPIILRPVFWQGAPFGKLQVLPANSKPVTDQTWHTLDDAFLNVTEGLRQAIEHWISAHQTSHVGTTDNSSALPSFGQSQTIIPSPAPSTNGQIQVQLPDDFSSVVSISLPSSSTPDVTQLVHVIDTDDVLDRVWQGNIPPTWHVFRRYGNQSHAFATVGLGFGSLAGVLIGFEAAIITGTLQANGWIIALSFFGPLLIGSLIGLGIGWMIDTSKYVCVLMPQGIILHIGSTTTVNFSLVTSITIAGDPSRGVLRVKKRDFETDAKQAKKETEITLNFSKYKRKSMIISMVINTYQQYKTFYPDIVGES